MRYPTQRLKTYQHRANTSLAIVMSFACGLMPKFNLTVCWIAGWLLLRKRQPMLLIGTFISGLLLADLCLPTLVQIGITSSRLSNFADWGVWSENLPILPWFRWSNAAVLGSLTAAWCAFPVLWLATEWIVLMRWVVSKPPNESTAIIEILKTNVISQPITIERQLPLVTEILAVPPMSYDQVSATQSLGQVSANVMSNAELAATEELAGDPLENARREINQIKELVEGFVRFDQPLFGQENVVIPSRKSSIPKARAAVHAAAAAADEFEIEESIIEIIRFSQSTSSSTLTDASMTMGSTKSTPSTDCTKDLLSSSTLHSSITMLNQNPRSSISPPAMLKMTGRPQPPAEEIAISATASPPAMIQEKPRDEALRFLLWHLSGIRENSVETKSS